MNYQPIEDILRYHKIGFDDLNTLVTIKYRYKKNYLVLVSHDQTNRKSLLYIEGLVQNYCNSLYKMR